MFKPGNPRTLADVMETPVVVLPGVDNSLEKKSDVVTDSVGLHAKPFTLISGHEWRFSDSGNYSFTHGMEILLVDKEINLSSNRQRRNLGDCLDRR